MCVLDWIPLVGGVSWKLNRKEEEGNEEHEGLRGWEPVVVP